MPSPAEMASALDPATAIMQSPVLQVDPMANALLQHGAMPTATMSEMFPHLYSPGEPAGLKTPGELGFTKNDLLNKSALDAGMKEFLGGQSTSPNELANPGFQHATTPQTQAPISDQHISDALQQNPGASIFDIAGVNPQAASQSLAAPAVAKSSSGPLGGTPQARAMFEQHIAPHMDEPTFAQQYFAGMHSPSVSFRTDPWNQMTFEGPLVKNGQQIGNISREINPETGEVHHGYLKFNGPTQGAGLGKQLLGNQVDLYNKMGMKSIGLFANIDVGGYAWAKYGFQPKPYDWTTLQSGMNRRLMGLHQSGEISPEALDAAQTLIRQPDPKALWNISDITGKTKSGEPLGKKLLLNQSWSGSLNLKDPETMDRFNAYINKGK